MYYTVTFKSGKTMPCEYIYYDKEGILWYKECQFIGWALVPCASLDQIVKIEFNKKKEEIDCPELKARKECEAIEWDIKNQQDK